MKKTPDEWAREDGYIIMDPDGWRGPGQPSFTEPCTYEEFEKRFGLCTVAKIDQLRKSGWDV